MKKHRTTKIPITLFVLVIIKLNRQFYLSLFKKYRGKLLQKPTKHDLT